MSKPLSILLFLLGLGLAITNFVLRVALNIQLPGGYFLSFIGFILAAIGLMYLKKAREKAEPRLNSNENKEKEELRDFDEEDHSKYMPK